MNATTPSTLPGMKLVMAGHLLGKVMLFLRIWDGPHAKVRFEYRDKYGMGEATIPVENLLTRLHGNYDYAFAYMTDEQITAWLASNE